MVLSRIVKVCHSIVKVCHGCHGFVMSLSLFVMVCHGLSRFVIKLSWFVTVTKWHKKRAFLTIKTKSLRSVVRTRPFFRFSGHCADRFFFMKVP
jgi:hypothetical protein